MKAEWTTGILSDCAIYKKSRISTKNLNRENYISTENMLPNRQGIQEASSLPESGSVTSILPGDILISNIRPYFKKIWMSKFSGGCSNDVLCFVSTPLCEPRFLYYLLSSDAFFEYMMAGAKGTKMPRGDKEQIMRYPVSVPDKKTQKKIVAIMACIDEKIAILADENHNLEEQAKAIFKSWFVDFEPFQNGKFVDSELGCIPQGWKIGSLSDIADVTMGQSPKGDTYNEEAKGTVFYQGRAEFADRFPQRRLFTTDPKRMATAGDILLSVRAPVGDMNIANESCCIGRGLAAIHAKDGLQSFVFYTMDSIREELDKYNGEGTVFGCINKDALNAQKVIIPPAKIAHDYEKIAAPLDYQYLIGAEENMRLARLRDTLLPKLMSGEIDVSEVTI